MKGSTLSKLDKTTKRLLGDLAEFGILPKDIESSNQRRKKNENHKTT